MREIAPPASAGIAKNRLKEIKEKLHKPLAIAAVVGALAVPSALASEDDPNPPIAEPLKEFVVGVQDDQAVSEEIKESRRVVEVFEPLDIDVWKVTAPWTARNSQGAQCAEIDNELLRYGNFFKVAKEYDLVPMINLIPGGGAGLGKPPLTPGDRKCYADTAAGYVNLFANENPGGTLVMEFPNEPNLKKFWRHQYDNKDKWVAPRNVVKTLAVTYQTVKKEADELGVKVIIVGPGLSPRQAIRFVKKMGSEYKDLDIQGPLMNALSYHPYAKLNNEPPDVKHLDQETTGVADLPDLKEALDESFKDAIPVWATEAAYNARVPTGFTDLYPGLKQNSPYLISESQIAKYYMSALKRTYCDGGGAFIFFNAIDDPSPSPDGGWWTGGLIRPLPPRDESQDAFFGVSLKPAYEAVRQTIADIKSGAVDSSC